MLPTTAPPGEAVRVLRLFAKYAREPPTAAAADDSDDTAPAFDVVADVCVRLLPLRPRPPKNRLPLASPLLRDAGSETCVVDARTAGFDDDKDWTELDLSCCGCCGCTTPGYGRLIAS